MAKERLSMRKIREILRLKYECHLTDRQIAKSCLVARSTVANYLSPSFRIKKITAIITVRYIFKIFIMALLLFIL